MEPVRPLHDIFAGLAGDPTAARGPVPDAGDALRDGGHGDLPDALVAEAIVSYADTAPAEVAEHLAPFVAGHGPVPLDDPAAGGLDLAQGLALVATAPPGPPGDEPEPDPGDRPEDPFDIAFGEGTADVWFGAPVGSDEPGHPVEQDPATPVPDQDPAVPEPDPADLFPPPAETGDADDPGGFEETGPDGG